MSGLFDQPEIDMTAPPTLAPKRLSALPPVIASPFVEPTRPTAIAKVTAAGHSADKAAKLLAEIKLAGSFGLSDAEACIKLKCGQSSICSARNTIRHHLWFARRVPGGHGVDVIAWRLATADEERRNIEHERQLTAAGKRWKPLVPPAPEKKR